MTKAYNFTEIEKRWQDKWEADGLYHSDINPNRPKYYALTMLPYTSGDLHFGHWYPMAPSDARARYKRMNGYNVLYPIGFDAFGLPGENAAIKRGIHPKVWTYKNIDNMREDLISMIYHDLRSPLANVSSSLDVLDSMLPENDDENIRSLLNIAVRSVERIQRLTNSLLDISRLEAGQPVGNRQPTNILETIEDAAALVKPVAASKQQSLSTNLPRELPLVMMDGEMIRRVVAARVQPLQQLLEVRPVGLYDRYLEMITHGFST